MTFAVFHDYPGLEYDLPKFHEVSRPSGHPGCEFNTHYITTQNSDMTRLDSCVASTVCIGFYSLTWTIPKVDFCGIQLNQKQMSGKGRLNTSTSAEN